MDSPKRERGAVTAEFAVALPALVLVLAFVLAISSVALKTASLQAAARSGARLAAVEPNPQVVYQLVSSMAGVGATINIEFGERLATVTVTKQATIGPFNLGSYELRGSAIAVRELDGSQW